MEASTLQAPIALGRLSVSVPLLRLRSDEQLVALFRAGSEDAFRTIHDRYRQRLFAYARQMLGGSRQDAEDALQDVFVRAYGALRASQRPVSLRAWLYRVAHNRCIDQLRRPAPAAQEIFEVSRQPVHDPTLETERREELRRLVTDVGRLPDQQRSALLMRELQGMSYEELAGALGVSVAAVKSLLVRARMGLAESADAREEACGSIRADLALSCDRGVRASGKARRHLRDCSGCREYREQIRGTRRRIAALVPVGPLGFVAKLTGLGGTGAATTGAAASGGAGLAGGGAASLASAKVVAIICCAAAVTAGGASVVRAHHRHSPSPSPAVAMPGASGARAARLHAEPAPALPSTRQEIARRTGGTVAGAGSSPRGSGAAGAQSGSRARRGSGPLTGQDYYASQAPQADPAAPLPGPPVKPAPASKPGIPLLAALLGLLNLKPQSSGSGSPSSPAPTGGSASSSGGPSTGSGGSGSPSASSNITGSGASSAPASGATTTSGAASPASTSSGSPGG